LTLLSFFVPLSLGREGCKEFFAECLFVVGEFGGNDYNAPLFAGKDLREAYKLTPHVIRAISDGVEVRTAPSLCY
jgi:hypothetical protein